jgi:LysM repeat protein
MAAGAIHHYTVQPGDTLSGISQAVCGHAGQWQNVYQQNRAVVGGNPNLIYVGERLAFSCTVSVTSSTDAVSATPDGDDIGGGTKGTTSGHVTVPVVTGPVVAGSSNANLVTIARFMVAHGFTRAAAAGIAGDIDGESAGNPESVGDGGGGIIGWTPLPGGLVTGSPSRDLSVQLLALLTYTQIWHQYIALLNSASGPVAAGDIFSQYFERPAVLYSDTRPSVATAIYGQL